MNRPGGNVKKAACRVPGGITGSEGGPVSEAKFTGCDDEVGGGNVGMRLVPDPGRYEERVGERHARVAGPDQRGRLGPVGVWWKPRDPVEGKGNLGVIGVCHGSSLPRRDEFGWRVSDVAFVYPVTGTGSLWGDDAGLSGVPTVTLSAC